jgi:hypothetical protein
MRKLTEIIESIQNRAIRIGVVIPQFKLSITGDLIDLLLSEIKANFRQLYIDGLIDAEWLLDCFDEKVLEQHGIFAIGNSISHLQHIIVLGNASVTALHENMFSEVYDNASLVGSNGIHFAYNNARINVFQKAVVHAFDQATVTTYDKHNVVFINDKSRVTEFMECIVVQV